MPHPLTAQLAAAMFERDGSPSTDARGQAITIDRYRGWAEAALDSLVGLAHGTEGWGALEACLDDLTRVPPLEGDDRPAIPTPGLDARLQRAM